MNAKLLVFGIGAIMAMVPMTMFLKWVGVPFESHFAGIMMLSAGAVGGLFLSVGSLWREIIGEIAAGIEDSKRDARREEAKAKFEDRKARRTY